MPERGDREMRAIRAKLVDAVEVAFIVDPTQVNSAAVELMKSGICRATYFEKLMASSALAISFSK